LEVRGQRRQQAVGGEQLGGQDAQRHVAAVEQVLRAEDRAQPAASDLFVRDEARLDGFRAGRGRDGHVRRARGRAGGGWSGRRRGRARGGRRRRGGRQRRRRLARLDRRHALVHVAEAQALRLHLLVEAERLPRVVLLLRVGHPVVEVEVRRRGGLPGDDLLHALDGQLGTAGLDEEAGEELDGGAVVLVGGRHALQKADGAVVVAGGGGRLAALEREPGALEERDGPRGLSRLLVELGRRLQLVRALVARGRAVLHPRADVDAPRRRPALRRLIRARSLGQHADGLEQLRGALVVLALLEELRRLRDLVFPQRHLAEQVGGLDLGA